MKKQLVTLSSPSGGGKSTVAHYLLKQFPEFRLSVSATTRKQRPGETHGKEYYFLTREEFERAIANNEFIEYEEIFGYYYGTLKSEVSKAVEEGEKIIFDIDVKGALSIKKLFPDVALLIFLAPPSFDILEERLRNRKTESEAQIQTRLARARMEMSLQNDFDYIIVNDRLEETFKQVEDIVKKECY